MTELAARTSVEIEKGRRPGWIWLLFLTWVGVGVGMLLGILALEAPAALGVATAVPDTLGDGWHAPFAPSDGVGAVVANVAGFVVVVWAVVVPVRWLLPWATDVRPAWTWTALSVATGLGLDAVSPAVAVAGGMAIAGVAVRFLAYEADGRARPEPFAALLTGRRRWVVAALIPALLVAITTGYAIYHPVQARWSNGGEGTPGGVPVEVTRAPLTIAGPTLENKGGRSIVVLAIEPGRERGYALHLARVVMDKRIYATGPGDMSPYKPFTSFVVPPHAEAPALTTMVVSRAGCRPGATGRIDSVRVRYLLGGERTMELPLETPLTLTC